MKLFKAALIYTLVCLASPLHADDLDTILKKVLEYVDAGNYRKAKAELLWANKELDKLDAKKLTEFLPENLSGFSGSKPSVQSAMGFNSFGRKYVKDDIRVEVSLMGGLAAGGGLAAITQMALMMQGSNPDADTFRIDGHTAILESNDKNMTAKLTVTLKSGNLLQFEMRRSADGNLLRDMAEAVDLDGLDKYLRGEG